MSKTISYNLKELRNMYWLGFVSGFGLLAWIMVFIK